MKAQAGQSGQLWGCDFIGEVLFAAVLKMCTVRCTVHCEVVAPETE